MNRIGRFANGCAVVSVILLSYCMLLWGGYYTGIQTITTSGTRVHLSAASPIPPTSCILLTVQAKPGNTGTIYVGGPNVSASSGIGMALVNGSVPAASVSFGASSTTALFSPSALWLDATVSGDGVSYGCYK